MKMLMMILYGQVMMTQFIEDLNETLKDIRQILIEKNDKYGNSALQPVRIFSKSDQLEGIRVRIDDKLNRLMNRKDNEDEDVITDLIGYLILYKIASK